MHLIMHVEYLNFVKSIYITDKIIDALIAGYFPIFLGANNINEYIPKICFFDKRKYGSYIFYIAI